MNEKPDIKVGDELRVLSSNPYRKTPEGGHRATVTKVGRKYGTAAYAKTHAGYGGAGVTEVVIEFDLVTGVEKGSNPTTGYRVETPAQVELLARRNAAITSLSDRKIRLDSGHGFTLEQIEALAEVVKTWED